MCTADGPSLGLCEREACQPPQGTTGLNQPIAASHADQHSVHCPQTPAERTERARVSLREDPLVLRAPEPPPFTVPGGGQLTPRGAQG